MNYPQLSTWQLRFIENQNGQALFWVLGLMVMIYLAVMVRKFPILTRVVVTGAVVVGWLSAAGTILVAAAGVAGFGVYTHRAYPKLLPRLTALPHWIVLSVLALIVRLPRLFEPFWYDETFTAGLAKLPLDKLFLVVQSDVHPPLWYMVSWLTGRTIGWFEAALRLPSLAFGVLAVLLVYRLTLALKLDRRVALVAGVLAALMPGAAYYSVEARGYTLLICAVLGAAIGLLENKKLLFIGCGVIALYTHNLAWAYVGLLGVLAVIQHGRSWWKPVAATWAAGALWLPLLLAQSGDIADGFWLPPISWGWAISPLLTVTTGHRIPDSALGMTSGVMIALTLWALGSQWRWIIRRENWIWGILAVGAPVGLATASALWHNVYLERALLSSIMAFCILWARGLVEGERGNRRVMYVALVPTLIVANLYFHVPEFSRPPIGAQIAKACENSDATFITSVAGEFVTSYYLPSPPVVWPLANDLNQTLPQTAKVALGWPQATFEELPKGAICVVDVDTPLARGDEREYLQHIINDYPSRSAELHTDGAYDIKIHWVMKNE